MFLPAALRYDVGADYFSYIRIYELIENNRNLDAFGYPNVEGGYVILNKLLILLGLDGQWVVAVMAFLTLVFLFCAVQKKTFYIIIPYYVVLFYLHSLNIIRQVLVITMAYYAYQLFEKKKIIRSLLIVFFSSFFHKSAYIYILVFIIFIFIRMNKKQIAGLFMLIMISNLYIVQIIDFLTRLVISKTEYVAYISSGKFFASIQTNSGFGLANIVFFLIYTGVIVSVLISIPKIVSKQTSNVLLLFIFLVASFSLSTSIWVFTRLEIAFRLAWFPLVDLFYDTKSAYRKIIMAMLFLVFFWLFIIYVRGTFMESIQFQMKNNLTPYKTIFNKE
jgi:hypothetical protein